MANQQNTTFPVDTTEWAAFFESLPGGELIRKGLADLQSEARIAPALLVLIGGARLQNLGLSLTDHEGNPEHAWYDLLSQDDPDSAHSRYNALIRTLVSFERATECAKR